MCRVVVDSIEVLHHSFALCSTEGLLMILSAFCDTDLGLKKHNMGWKSFSLSNVARRKKLLQNCGEREIRIMTIQLLPAALQRGRENSNFYFVPLK